MTVNKGKSSLVLYAFYDLQICTVTFDFLSFLLRAELRRIQVGCKSLHIVFVPGADDGFRMMHLSGDISRWRLQNMHIAACSFLSSIKGITVCPTRAQATSIEDNLASNIFPVDYTTHIFDSQKAIQASIDAFMFAGVVIRHLKGDEVPVLTPTLRAQQYVREWYEKHANGRKVIAITLRESPNDPARNSNLDAWARFAATIDENEFLPVIIRDTDAVFLPVPQELKGLCHFNEAAIDLDLRLAFYESAFLNMLVNNGPLQICYLNPKIRYLAYKMFNVTNDADEKATCAVYGIPIGGQLPMATPFQRVIWDDDNYETLMKSFTETSCAINEAFRRKQLKRIEKRHCHGRDESFRIAVTLHEVSWYKHALDIYEHLLTIDRHDVEVATMRGLALLHLGRSEEAKTALKSCHECKPELTQCSFNLALAETSTGNTIAAIEILERLKNSASTLKGIPGCLGKLYLSEKRFEEAADTFSAVVGSDPFDWRTWLHLAACQEELGRSKRALSSYNTCLRQLNKQEQFLKRAEVDLIPWKGRIFEGRHNHLILPGFGAAVSIGNQLTDDIQTNNPEEVSTLVVFDLDALCSNYNCHEVYEGFKKIACVAAKSANHICVVPQSQGDSVNQYSTTKRLIAKWLPTVHKNKGISIFSSRNEAMRYLAVYKNVYDLQYIDDLSYSGSLNPTSLDGEIRPLRSTPQAQAYIANWKSAFCNGSDLIIIALAPRHFKILNKNLVYAKKLRELIKANKDFGIETFLVVPSESHCVFSLKETERYSIHMPACLNYDLRQALFEKADKICGLDVEIPLNKDTVFRIDDFETLFKELNCKNFSKNPPLNVSDAEMKIDDAYKMGVRFFCGGATTFNKGVHIFQRIIQVVPQHANAIGMLGIAANMVRKHKDAIDLFHRAILIRDDEPAFHFNLGNAFFEEGNYQEALHAYKTAAGNQQNLYEPWDCLGDTYVMLGDEKAAILAYEKAISLGTNEPDSFARLAKCYENVGNTQMALKSYKVAGVITKKRDNQEQACITMIWPWKPKLIRPENGEFIGGYLG